MSEKDTSIRVKEETRKRLSYVREVMNLGDMDACISSLLDGAGYPSWAEVEGLSKKRTKARPKEASA